MKDLAKAISSGSLRGARGNSGVILSQLLRGFTKAIKEEKEIDVLALAAACQRARDTAYKAVMKPKEGTILTVASGIATKAAEMAEETDDLEVFIEPSTGVTVNKANAEDTADIKFGYCTEFIILTEKEFTEDDEREFKKFLSSIGDSIVCVADDDVVKIHVHTNDPGLAIQKALIYGQLSKMKIDNMREEHQEKLIREAEKLAEQQANEEAAHEEKKPAEPRKAMGFIAVSIGAGMNEIFKELGADYIIEGGQTMNPSTEDMLNAIDRVNADTVFILPNNKNIVLAANQAKSLVEEKEIIVIPTKTVPQGITAIINFMPDADAKTNEEAMLEEIKNVKTGQVTYAVRDTHIDDKEIHEGDIMGIGDSGILAVGKDLEETTKELIANLVDEDSELISIYYGEEVSEEDAEKFTEEITELYPDVDVDIQFGGQPIYYYVLAVE